MDSFSNPDKFINDPLHGMTQFSSLDINIIDTPQFFRLRSLKQLGTTHFVFPGATHSRFEHSLGVAHLAEAMMMHLKQSQPELDITSREVGCVKLAGLCHDLGHGPYSHVFDGSFIPQARPGIVWTHEMASEMLFDHLVDENNIDLEQEDVRLVKDLIAGTGSHRKKFLFDVVANKRNSVDVDKFDYIQRDCYYTGLRSSYDPSRLILMSRVIDDEVCFSHKEVYTVYEMFHMRYSLFKRIYTHKVSKAIEYMLVDVLLAADNYFQISNSIHDPVAYTRLTDDIINTIQYSKAPELDHAKAIIERLIRRHLYKYVDEYNISSELAVRRTEVTAGAIIQYHQYPTTVSENDLIIQWMETNYGKGDKNPVDYVKFFGKWDENKSYNIPRDRVSFVVPQRYSDITIRIFTRDAEKVPGIQKAFRKWVKTTLFPLEHQQSKPRAMSSSSVDSFEFVSGNTVPFTDDYWRTISEKWSPNKTPKPAARGDKFAPGKSYNDSEDRDVMFGKDVDTEFEALDDNI